MAWLIRCIRRLPLIRHILQINVNIERMDQQLKSVRDLMIEDYINKIVVLSKYQQPGRIIQYQTQVYSQNGEDGMITEIFRRIGTTNRFFMEFGVGDGMENNTLYLLVQGWRGCWIDRRADLWEKIEADFGRYVKDKQLNVTFSSVSAENIEELFHAMRVPKEFDLLSIDIDGNDYWVWRAIEQFHPRAVVIEYNALFPPPIRCVVKYGPNRVFEKTAYFGASLKSLELLGASKGYSLIGCDLTGTNAFFVRSDLCDNRFAAPYTAENHYEPPRYFLVRRIGHKRGFGDFETI